MRKFKEAEYYLGEAKCMTSEEERADKLAREMGKDNEFLAVVSQFRSSNKGSYMMTKGYLLDALSDTKLRVQKDANTQSCRRNYLGIDDDQGNVFAATNTPGTGSGGTASACDKGGNHNTWNAPGSNNGGPAAGL